MNDLLDEIYSLGINTFDTAENYGLSEVSMGNWMKERKNRCFRGQTGHWNEFGLTDEEAKWLNLEE